MKYVYLLRSVFHPDERYVGVASNFQEHLRQHNAGQAACLEGAAARSHSADAAPFGCVSPAEPGQALQDTPG